MNFRTLHLINPIIRAVTEAGYSRPTEMQCAAIPAILAGRDIIGYAEPGTEKTAAFIMPVLQLLKKRCADHIRIRTLILVPNRERAIQIEDHLTLYSKYLPLSQLSVFGGIEAPGQLAALKKRVDILIATPERLLDLAGKRFIDLSRVEIMIVDEADRLTETGFADEIKQISQMIPRKRQILLFSATLPEAVNTMAGTIMNNPLKICIAAARTAIIHTQQPVYGTDKEKEQIC
ncbi:MULTISPECIES: DEAD/DEAH box helicase [Chryseobacterium]|uniref:Superfamily II DNA/RNA helicase n=1 Tax=Chryseobacterium camelliae TaxID=1265445 RepID=A0ABU0THS0_9FLAO|nr:MULTISPECIES: DEAD/DEAH box helicase [Chryseobacterium]MDT3409537.1 superfamily II DNA/RNA helicase [Pseudacidovorax intermedius]MDQ1096600.1 superfamily II DNA/RNA helicase [Chryseobacterium camelliae]MDQ1100541.1 superfamily II DNA/RNA helicase [Chryseobacterium sp. SORGH_AS_1048]MDR6087882.1 superfamily II DNA/RNA helicase [Chryseobacterium sp. SORGH_AS_0909]MDR6132257.1 superfamily II DNA/RNA helicase [Chryseobacterium sp. SORGH_AS_1175]